MNQSVLTGLTFVTGLAAGLVSGVFFAFSSFVMQALARLSPSQGIQAMQSINVTVINKWFLGAFLGTGAACLLLAVLSLRSWDASALLRLAGCAAYLVGTLFVTRAFNIPLNDTLARLDPDASSSAAIWAGFLADWTFWNHVRTLAALIAAALLSGAHLASTP
jgi:uncharacterized membrane protein